MLGGVTVSSLVVEFPLKYNIDGEPEDGDKAEGKIKAEKEVNGHYNGEWPLCSYAESTDHVGNMSNVHIFILIDLSIRHLVPGFLAHIDHLLYEPTHNTALDLYCQSSKDLLDMGAKKQPEDLQKNELLGNIIHRR